MKKSILILTILVISVFAVNAQKCRIGNLGVGQKNVYPLGGDPALVKQTAPKQFAGPASSSFCIDRLICSFMKIEDKAYFYTLNWLDIPPAVFTPETRIILTLSDNSKVELKPNSEQSIVQLKKVVPHASGQMKKNEEGVQIGLTTTYTGTVYYLITLSQIKKLVESPIVNIEIEVLNTETNEIFVCYMKNIKNKTAAKFQNDAACILTLFKN